MRNLRGGLPEESDRAERINIREEFQDCGVLPFLRDKPGKRPPCLHKWDICRATDSEGLCRELRDKPGKRPPCLHERTSDGQRTVRGCAANCAISPKT